jgi:hypothetical protein
MNFIIIFDLLNDLSMLSATNGLDNSDQNLSDKIELSVPSACPTWDELIDDA